MLLIFFGNIGTGKTTLAKTFVKSYGYECICFDDVVNELFRGRQIYGRDDDFLLSMDETLSVYDEMHKRAKALLKQGKNVVLESMYFKKQREEAKQIAKKLGISFKVVEIVCSEDEIKQRLDARKAKHSQSPGFALYLKYKNLLEPEAEKHITIDTTGKSVETCLQELSQKLA